MADERRPNDGPQNNDSDHGPDLAELIRYMAVNLVDKPDEVRVELVEEDALDDTERGSGGFGHTG